MRGDVIIQGLWDWQVKSIIDVKLGDADADSYKYEPMEALLVQWETINKGKQINHCNDQQKEISLSVLSVYVMLVREVLVVLAQLSRVLVLPKKRRDKMVSQSIFSTPANDSLVSQVTHCINIHSLAS